MTQKHTPLPWKTGYTKMDGYNFTTIVNANGQHIATVDISDDKANAAFIVRSCNSHYELLAVCKRELAYYPTYAKCSIEAGERRDALVAAIAIAEAL